MPAWARLDDDSGHVDQGLASLDRLEEVGMCTHQIGVNGQHLSRVARKPKQQSSRISGELGNETVRYGKVTHMMSFNTTTPEPLQRATVLCHRAVTSPHRR